MRICDNKYSNPMGIRILVAYKLHLSFEEYIPYILPSSRNNYGTPIPSEKTNIHKYNPAQQCTPPGGV